MANDNQQQNAGTQLLGGCLLLILFGGVCGGCGWWIWPWWSGGGSDNKQPPPVPLVGKQDGKPDVSGQNLDFTGLRGILSGKWQSKKDGSEPHPHLIEFTRKSIDERRYSWSNHVGKYEVKGDLLHITDRDGNVNIYGLEFLSDGEIALRPEKLKNGSNFNNLQGQWRRISLPTGTDAAPLGTGPLADAKGTVSKFEKKRLVLEPLLEKAFADRDDLVAKLREAGIKTPADLKGNFRGQQLAGSLQRLSGEIDGLERQIAAIDTAILEAKAVVRRMEREEAGISEAEMRKLAEQLRDAEERTDGAGKLVTPFDVETTLEKALKATPAPKKKTALLVDSKLDGQLTKNDPKDSVRTFSVHKAYTVNLTAGKSYTFDLVSRDFDAYLRLEDSSFKQLAHDDDSGGNLNARIIFQAPKDDTYRIIVTTFTGGIGSYTLTLRGN